MKNKVIAAALILSMFSGTAYAKITVSENSDTRVINVKGTIEGTEATNLAAINVYNENGELVYTYYVPTEDGNIDHDFNIPDVNGTYNIQISSFGALTEEKIEYLTTAEMQNIIGTVNGTISQDTQEAEKITAVIALLDQYPNVLTGHGEWYKKLDTSDKIKIAEEILKTEQYSSVEEIKSASGEEFAVACFNICKNSADISAVSEEFADTYNFSDNVSLYSAYLDFDNVQKDFVNEILSEGSYDSLAEMYSAFDIAILLEKINTARDPEAIKEAIENNRTIITFDLKYYDNADSDSVALYLYGKISKSMSGLEQYIKEAYDAQQPEGGGNSPSSKKSSNGSGKKTSSGPAAYTSTAVPIEQPKKEEPKVYFNDLGSVSWAVDAINYLAENKVITGVAEGVFAPDGKVTREQFVQMIVKAFDIKGNSEKEFSDIPKNHWAYNSISAAIANGITSGIGDGIFGVEKEITRQDMAVMAVSAAEKSGRIISGNISIDFDDIDTVSDYAMESIKKMTQAGIMNGFGDNTLKPFETATRAQAAGIIYMILQGEEEA